jgi:hypothetical protein
VTAASITGSRIYAGIQGGNPALPNSATAFDGVSTIRNVTIRNRLPAAAFVDSNIAASTLGKINLGAVQVNNGGNAFGLAAQTINSFSATNAGTPMRGAHLTEPTQSLDFTDFHVRIF